MKKSNQTYNIPKASNFAVLAFFWYFLITPKSEDAAYQLPLNFQHGEQLNYDAYYNMGSIWIPAGKVRYEVKDTLYNNIKCLMLDGKGKSLKAYDSFFRVRDRYTSIVDAKDMKPYNFVRQVNEGGFKLYYNYFFDQVKHKATVYTTPQKTDKPTVIDFPSDAFDVMSSVYRARNIDYSKYKKGDKIQLRMMVDKTVYDNVYITYDGKEIITAEDGTKYRCIKIKPQLIEGTIFQEGEEMNVYVTDDNNRIPIYIEAEIVVGSIKAYLTSFKGLKYPLTSVVK